MVKKNIEKSLDKNILESTSIPSNIRQNIKSIKNSFTIYQIKKMIGKKLIIPWNGLNISIQDKNIARLNKIKILETKTNKNLVITTFCNQGILFVIRNIDIYLAISLISYKELENIESNITVIIIQYDKLNKSEINEIIYSK